MSKTPLIFTACIIATILITALTVSSLTSVTQGDGEPFFGSLDAEDGVLHQPRGVAVNGSGNIFVADTNNGIIQVFNADGAFNFTFSTADNNPNDKSLFKPGAITINSTDWIFVANTFGNNVKLYDKGGIYTSTIGSVGDGSGQLLRPHGITFNATHIFVADTQNNRIQIYALDDELIDDTIP